MLLQQSIEPVSIVYTMYTFEIKKNCSVLYHLFCNALVHVIYSVVSGQYSYIIP